MLVRIILKVKYKFSICIDISYYIFYISFIKKLGNNNGVKAAIKVQARRKHLLDPELAFLSWLRRHEGKFK